MVGGWFTELVGYGGTKESIIGFGVLFISLLLFLFRRIVQDKQRPHWREETPTMPDEHVAKLLAERCPGVGRCGRGAAAGRLSRFVGQNHAHGSAREPPEFEVAMASAIAAPRRSARRTT